MSSHSGLLFHLGMLRFAGPDAVAFLQGQISNDARRLAAGRPLLAAYSTPQGRVLAILHLLPHSSGVIGILPRELLAPTLEQMRKYVLRAKVRIEDTGERFAVAGRHGAAAIEAAGLTAPDAAQGYVESAGVGIGRVGADARFWVIGEAALLAARGLAGNAPQAELVEHDWRLADIRAGLAQIYAATREMYVAQMLNLDLVDGISFNKGCFTGQEIIARTQHLGRIKRRMMRLMLRGASFEVGQALRLADGRSGRLTEVVRVDGGFEALAVLNVDAAAADGAAGGEAAGNVAVTDADILPLPYALTQPA